VIRWTTPVSRKRITYQTERVGTTKIRRVILHSGRGLFLDSYSAISWNRQKLKWMCYHSGKKHFKLRLRNLESELQISTEVVFLEKNCKNIRDIKSKKWSNQKKMGVTRTILKRSYNKINEIHQFLKFIFGMEIYTFRRRFISIIRNLVLYTQQ